MANSIKLKLHKIKCIDLQEAYKDEIILWGVMVSNNNLFMVTPEIPERSFWEGSVKNFDPPTDLITIPLSNHDLQTSVVAARAAVWIVEIDNYGYGYKFWDNEGNEAYTLFQKMFQRRVDEIRHTNPGITTFGLQAFRDILPAYHQKIIAANSSPWWTAQDDNEVFPYIYTDFASTQLPATHPEVSPVSKNIKSAYGGKYEVDLSWSLVIG